MRQIVTRLSAILLYIGILLYIADFRFSLLWDFKSIMLVLTGTLLLTAAGYRRGMDRESLFFSIRYQSMSAAYLTAFIGLYTEFVSGKVPADQIIPSIALSCRPLLYGFIISLLFRDPSDGRRKNAFQPAPGKKNPENGEKQTSEAGGNKPETIFSKPAPEIILQYLTTGGLTKREMEVALLVREGLTNKEIGEKLFISDTTVKKHISNIFEKLDLQNREQLKNIGNHLQK